MLISPPFLPERNASESEAHWIERAMKQPPGRMANTNALEGSFPVSAELQWHNGLHIEAPQGADGNFPFRLWPVQVIGQRGRLAQTATQARVCGARAQQVAAHGIQGLPRFAVQVVQFEARDGVGQMLQGCFGRAICH